MVTEQQMARRARQQRARRKIERRPMAHWLLWWPLLAAVPIIATGGCTFPPAQSGCGPTGCFKDSTNCTSAPFMYCPNDDPTWGAKTPTWKDCLNDRCYQSETRVANASCAALCAPLWEASNKCSADDCSYALAGSAPKLCPITPITWSDKTPGWPATNNTKVCATFKQQPMCTLFACVIATGGPNAGCWKPEND